MDCSRWCSWFAKRSRARRLPRPRCAGRRVLREEHQAASGRALLRLPFGSGEEGSRRLAPRQQVRLAERRGPGAGDQARRPAPEPADRGGRLPGRAVADAAGGQTVRPRSRDAHSLGGHGCPRSEGRPRPIPRAGGRLQPGPGPVVASSVGGPGHPRGRGPGVAEVAARSFHPRETGTRRPAARARSGQADIDPSRHLRPDRPSSLGSRGRGLPGRQLTRGLRQGRRSAPGLAALRGTVGEALARRGPVLRLQRTGREHGLRERLALSRLRHCRDERRSAVRPVRPRTTCRRPAPTGRVTARDSPPLGRHRLPLARAEVAGRGRRAEDGDGHRRRADRHGRTDLHGPDARLRPLPRPQVRPHLHGRLLRAGRDLPEHPDDGFAQEAREVA